MYERGNEVLYQILWESVGLSIFVVKLLFAIEAGDLLDSVKKNIGR